MIYETITKNEKLMDEWHWEKNNALNIFPEKLTFGSSKKVWWRCFNQHSFLMRVCDRKDRNCPYCSNRKILKGFNDLTTTHPSLVEEWDFDNNINILPSQITYGSEKKVWWKCKKCSYKWFSSPNHRTNLKTGCPACSNKVLVKGLNDLETLYPNIAKKWHPTLNKLKASGVFPGSNNKAWWICEKDKRHYFETRIYLVVNGKTICPICSNKKVIVGVNDFATICPDLLKEWDFDKNKLKPTEVTSGSHNKVWWKCKNGHSWKTEIVSRTGKQKCGCPICKKELFVSFPEKVVSYYLSKYFIVETNKKFSWLGNSELDIYLPEFYLAIEYDGQAWHKDVLRDLKKDVLCDKNKIQLFRIREKLCPVYESKSIKLICEKQNLKMLKENILYIIEYINKNFGKQINAEVDIEKDYTLIIEKMDLMTKDNSVANSYLIDEWNWKKNQGVNPETIQLGTHKKIWWICKLGHEWKSAVYCRTGKQKCGCPYCAGQKVIFGWNDFATLYPNFVKEWDYVKNDVLPNTIRPRTNKKFWWICKDCDYEWFANPSHRVSGRGCPKCARKITTNSHFKEVLCIDKNIVYNSVKEAGKKNNINPSSISNCCRGLSKTAGGYRWEYVKK